MKDQRNKIKEIFERRANEWVPLPDILPYAAQYGARILELRRTGMVIENKKEKVNGEWHSWFRYTPPMTSYWQEQRKLDEQREEASLFR